MRATLALAMISMVLTLACGGSGAASAPPDAGPTCLPLGRWELSYRLTAGSPTCVGPGDTLRIAADDAGVLTASLDAFKPVAATCGPDAGTVEPTVTAVFYDGGCQLSLAAAISYCQSGETQCSQRALSLTFAGEAAQGSGTSGLCWCNMPSISSESLSVTGTHLP